MAWILVQRADDKVQQRRILHGTGHEVQQAAQLRFGGVAAVPEQAAQGVHRLGRLVVAPIGQLLLPKETQTTESRN